MPTRSDDLFDQSWNADQMRLIEAIARTGSITKGAAEVGLSQPAASQSLKRLESSLGQPLFHRIRQGLRPTRDGRAYLSYAKAMLNLAERARLHFVLDRTQGTLRIGMTDDLSATSLPMTLSLFAKQHPGLYFSVTCGTSLRLLERFDNGEFDVVVAKRPEGRLQGETLWRDKLVWLGNVTDSAQLSDPIHLVAMPAPHPLRTAMIESLVKAGRDPRVVFEGSSLTTLQAAIDAGLGVTAWCASLHRPNMRAIPDGILPELGEVDIVMEQRAGSASQELNSFCQFVRECTLAVRNERSLETED